MTILQSSYFSAAWQPAKKVPAKVPLASTKTFLQFCQLLFTRNGAHLLSIDTFLHIARCCKLAMSPFCIVRCCNQQRHPQAFAESGASCSQQRHSSAESGAIANRHLSLESGAVSLQWHLSALSCAISHRCHLSVESGAILNKAICPYGQVLLISNDTFLIVRCQHI